MQIGGGALLLGRLRGESFEVVSGEDHLEGHEFSPVVHREAGNLKFSPHYAQDSTVFGASGHDVLISTDGGSTWSATARPMRYEAELAERESVGEAMK